MTEQSQRKIRIEWKRSAIGFTRRQRASIRGLGLRRLHDVVERVDTPQVRGLVSAIPHLVAIVEASEKPAPWTNVPEYTIHPPEPQEAPVKRARKESKAAAAAVPEEAVAATEAEEKPAAKSAKVSKATKAKSAAPKKAAAKKKESAKKPSKPKTSKGKK